MFVSHQIPAKDYNFLKITICNKACRCFCNLHEEIRKTLSIGNANEIFLVLPVKVINTNFIFNSLLNFLNEQHELE